ncbi:response regulator receiver modulated diguanylate cyclase [Candidatus Magnetoovum chiemensis]|nr:response regulator receiver modulated diguanylate cyclase [Candidatus Magnetoovum chiemensis]
MVQNPIKQEIVILKDLTILYVEDDDSVRESLDMFLKRRFKHVLTAPDGRSGLNMFKEHRPDIVITDLQMPIMNGLEMSASIKEISKDTPIIVTTAFSEMPYLVKSIELGIEKYIKKPIIKDELIESLIKCAKVIIQKKQAKEAGIPLSSESYSYNLFTAIVKHGKFFILSDSFLNFLGYQNMNEFNSSDGSFSRFITSINEQKMNANNQNSWFRILTENADQDNFIELLDKRSSSSVIFKVTVKYTKDMDTYLLELNKAD